MERVGVFIRYQYPSSKAESGIGGELEYRRLQIGIGLSYYNKHDDTPISIFLAAEKTFNSGTAAKLCTNAQTSLQVDDT